MDNATQEIHVVSVMTHSQVERREKVRDENDDRLLPPSMRRQNILTERDTNPHSDQAINRKTRKTRMKIPCRFVFCRIPSCGFCPSPVSPNHKSERGRVYVDKCHFRYIELFVERWCGRISCDIGVYKIGLCVF